MRQGYMKMFLICAALLVFPHRLFSQTTTNRAQSNNFLISADIGYTVNNYLSINAAVSKGLWYYGFSGQINVSTGEKGKSYDKIINWDNDLDGVSDAGDYYLGAFGFDLGYYFLENLCFGGGLGYAPHKMYRNFHDDTEILSQSGWYHVSKGDGGRIDAKAFVHYFFKKGLTGGRFYIGGQYSITGSVGIHLGYQFGSL
ncbi:hypothetical protein [Bacteroides finegoldii]|uniref:hypothetical protein n=1 Tax=Bacteroides finegoldii TaxID=338188 RepID=UPI0026665F0B|nr:hypothetical protein [Bacteroides finegoldii]